MHGGILNEGELCSNICIEVLQLMGEITGNNVVIRPMFGSMWPT
mgnify:CR=1